jgi:hypothetical protein
MDTLGQQTPSSYHIFSIVDQKFKQRAQPAYDNPLYPRTEHEMLPVNPDCYPLCYLIHFKRQVTSPHLNSNTIVTTSNIRILLDQNRSDPESGPPEMGTRLAALRVMIPGHVEHYRGCRVRAGEESRCLTLLPTYGTWGPSGLGSGSGPPQQAW